ncbi:MAG: hypothetical protein HYZ53_30540 [Planctomycetes bacterium]|nr:hypothetical protein [Planctomycetota bacterium]
MSPVYRALVRVYAANALAGLGASAREAIEPLSRLQEEGGGSFLSDTFADALARLGPEASPFKVQRTDRLR